MTRKPDPFTVPFGTILCDWVTTARADGGPFIYDGSPEPYGDFTISPAAHVLHYGSAIFEGLEGSPPNRWIAGHLPPRPPCRSHGHQRRPSAAARDRSRHAAPDDHRRSRGQRRGGSRPARVAVHQPDANFFLADDERVVTRHLDETFLHGITRDSVIQLAQRLGYDVQERSIHPDELLDWSQRGEAFLSGTGAGLAPVGTILYAGNTLTIGDGQPGPNTMRLRQALTDIQLGAAPDPFGWRTPVHS